jgi:hypothetical protein
VTTLTLKLGHSENALLSVAYPGFFFAEGGITPGIFFERGFQQIQLRTERKLQMSEPRILIRFLQMYFPCNWKFDSSLSKLRNFYEGGGVEPPKPSTPLGMSLTVITCI